MSNQEENRDRASGLFLAVLRNAAPAFATEYDQHLEGVAADLVERGVSVANVGRVVNTTLRHAWTLYPLEVLAACDNWTMADPGDGCALEDIIPHAARSALVSDLRWRMERIGYAKGGAR